MGVANQHAYPAKLRIRLARVNGRRLAKKLLKTESGRQLVFCSLIRLCHCAREFFESWNIQEPYRVQSRENDHQDVLTIDQPSGVCVRILYHLYSGERVTRKHLCAGSGCVHDSFVIIPQIINKRVCSTGAASSPLHCPRISQPVSRRSLATMLVALT